MQCMQCDLKITLINIVNTQFYTCTHTHTPRQWAFSGQSELGNCHLQFLHLSSERKLLRKLAQFSRTMWPSCDPANNAKALKETQSTDQPEKISCCSLSMFIYQFRQELEFNVPFQHKYGYIREKMSGVKSYPYSVKEGQ